MKKLLPIVALFAIAFGAQAQELSNFQRGPSPVPRSRETASLSG